MYRPARDLAIRSRNHEAQDHAKWSRLDMLRCGLRAVYVLALRTPVNRVVLCIQPADIEKFRTVMEDTTPLELSLEIKLTMLENNLCAGMFSAPSLRAVYLQISRCSTFATINVWVSLSWFVSCGCLCLMLVSYRRTCSLPFRAVALQMSSS